MRSAFEIVVAATLVGCGGAGAGVTEARSIPFTDHGSTQQSVYDGGPRIAAANDPMGVGLGKLASRDDGRLYIGVFAGAQRTGGYGIRVVRVDRLGDTLTVRAMFSVPAPAAITIQVLTSPAHLVSIERQSATGARDIVLVDQIGGRAGSRHRATIATLT